jgi:hypothetical protein
MILFCEPEVRAGYKSDFVKFAVCVTSFKPSLRWLVKLITMEMAIKLLSYMFKF